MFRGMREGRRSGGGGGERAVVVKLLRQEGAVKRCLGISPEPWHPSGAEVCGDGGAAAAVPRWQGPFQASQPGPLQGRRDLTPLGRTVGSARTLKPHPGSFPVRPPRTGVNAASDIRRLSMEEAEARLAIFDSPIGAICGCRDCPI